MTYAEIEPRGRNQPFYKESLVFSRTFEVLNDSFIIVLFVKGFFVYFTKLELCKQMFAVGMFNLKIIIYFTTMQSILYSTTIWYKNIREKEKAYNNIG